MIYIFYSLTLVILTIYSWGFVDPNAPFWKNPTVHTLVYFRRTESSFLYIGILASLFGFYFWMMRLIAKKKVGKTQVVGVIAMTIFLLLVSFPAFSNDIFNYIATAKVTYLYHENPYVVMPVEIRNEPMLKFLQASNKVALYGPTWILLSAIPHCLGFGNLLVTLFTFKLLAVVFYAALVWLIWLLSRNLWSVAFFALNPLVIIDTLVDAHNDITMMFFGLLSFYFARENHRYLGLVSLVISIFVKGATIFLLPVFWYVGWSKKKFEWQTVWKWSALAMYLIFFLSPIREEIYSWYFIWPLVFVALRAEDFLTWISWGFSVGLPLRFLPFVYWRNWGGLTAEVKKIVTFIPPLVAGVIYGSKNKK